MGGLTTANLQQPSFFGNTALLTNSAMSAMNNRTYALESQIRDNQSEIKAFIKAGKTGDPRLRQLETDNATLVNELQETRTRGQGESSRLQDERNQAYAKFADISRDLEVLEQRNMSLTQELSRSRASASGSRLSPTLESLFSGGGSTIRPEASQASSGDPTPQQSYGRNQIIEVANAKESAEAILDFHLQRGNRFLRGAKWEQDKAKLEANVRQAGQDYNRVKAELDQRTKSFNPTISYSAEEPQPEPSFEGELEGQSLFVGGVGAGTE
jgi:hypothetical protein